MQNGKNSGFLNGLVDLNLLGSIWAKPSTIQSIQGRILMTSHPRTDDAGLLTPQRREGSEEAYARNLMIEYKSSGCEQIKALIAEHYMNGFVKRVANRVAYSLPSCIDVQDLEQCAYFGLIDCIEKYNPARKIKFESFARLRVEGAMKDFLRKEDPVSRLARQRSKLIDKGINQFQCEHGRTPTNSELKARLGVCDDEFDTLMRDQSIPCTLSMSIAEQHDDEDAHLVMLVESKDRSFHTLERADLREWLFDRLCNVDKLIVTLHFVERLTMLEVGNVVGYSESRVSQRIKHVLKLLHMRLHERPDIALLMAS